MSSPPKTLSQDHLNLLRNDILKFEICPLVYQTIIEWGFEKPDGVKIIDHFNDRKILENSAIKLRPWLKKYNIALEKEDFSSFDVTTLHDLLPVLCYDKVAQHYSKEWLDKIEDTNSIEYLLKEIKDFRNDVSHEYSKAKEDPNIVAKQNLLRKCLITAGTFYGKDQSEIGGRIAHLDAKFDELVQETITYENAVTHVTELVGKESAPFMLEKYSELFSVPLPGGLGKVGTAQIFESVNLSVAVEDKNDKNKKKEVFSSKEICNHIKNKFIVINGGPGSGKTTLMRNFYQNILDNSVNGSELNYEGIGRFRVPIYLECRTERQNDLRDFLKESIPNFCSHKDVIYDAFKEMKGKVFLIDGYDEVNDKSRELVKDAIDFCSKNNAICIVSGRVDAGNNFIKDLKERNLNYDRMLIEQISRMSDKLSFLRKYGDTMGDDVDSEELVKSFENLNIAAQKVFFSPILLALFMSLFLNNKNCLSQLHNEQSAYKAIKGIFSEEIEKKLRECNVPNPKLTTKDILSVFSYYSFLLFKSEEYFFKEDDYDNLVRDCQRKISIGVDFEKLLTCILTPETSLKQDKTLTYAFTHSTIQEYLAIEQIIKIMGERDMDWNSEQFSEESLEVNFLECLGVSTTNSDVCDTHSGITLLTYLKVEKEIERYGNIIKLLMLETLANGNLTKYTRTFTAMLRENFKPKDKPDYLLNLVSSSNCDSAIVAIVFNVLGEESYYKLNCTRYFRPLTEVLKKRKKDVFIDFDCFESLTDTDCVNFGQLVSVLKDDSKIELRFPHSHDNFQPLNGEFYTQLSNSKCKVTAFKACVTSTEHLSIVMKLWGGKRKNSLYISTVSAFDVSFATLEELRGEINLRVKYTDNIPTNGSNPVTGRTIIIIKDIPADGRKNAYNNIKFLSPESKQFRSIELLNCHLTDTDANELLKKLEKEKMRTKEGEKTEVKEERVNEDKSRDLRLYLPDFEKREAKQREAKQRDEEKRETEKRRARRREARHRRAEKREAAQSITKSVGECFGNFFMKLLVAVTFCCCNFLILNYIFMKF